MSPNSQRLARGSGALATLVILATLVAPTVSASAAKTTSKSATTTTTPSLECTAAQLSYAGPYPVSPQAGAMAFTITITITNVSPHLCQVHGYPLVHFYTSAGRLLTFTYRHTSPFFTRTSPKLLNLAPHAHAYFEVAKSHCTTGNRYLSSFFYVRAPYTGGAPWVGHDADGGSAQLAYCKGSADGPGQVLGITPLVSSPTQF